MKINKNMALTILCLVGFSAKAEIVNGGFESWQGSLLTGWDTIDSGITVTQQNNVVKVGASSAQVTVNTASQASTDLLQNINVAAGKTYTFSTWVYHTEGSVKARLIVDGYQGYSDEHSVNQWQQIQYSYTAASSKQITVGLRFYDVAGFDGSEIVYVDDFQPSATVPPTDNQCIEDNVTLALTTDNYASETSWSLTGSAGEVASANGLANNTLYTQRYCLLPGQYTFTINDTYGDGICCTYGQGSYQITVADNVVVSGASFGRSESKTFTIDATPPDNGGGTPPVDLETYYSPVTGLTGFDLKTGLYNIIAGHSTQGYGAIWGFYELHALDVYYENDGSILDIYSEKPQGTDSYNYIKVNNQCGSYSGEGGCYNREHSFPKSWFGGQVEPMNSDIHHIFATDGFVNSKRSSFPYGEVAGATFTSSNGSQLGQASSTLGYSGTVFEPIDEFKGDLARAYFYMATRYENVIAGWQTNSSYGDAILNGSSDQVFENWHISMLLRWHQQDPVSQKEIDRNNAVFEHQGNRNPFIDHPEFAGMIWQ